MNINIKKTFLLVSTVFVIALSTSCGGSKVTVIDGSSGGSRLVDYRDEQAYRTVKIGGQVWMAENLNFETDSSWCFDNDESKCEKYGRLYSWGAAMSACPDLWHLPSRDEWDALVKAAGGKVAGKKLKAATAWNGKGGTDEFGFSALPGGFRIEFGIPDESPFVDNGGNVGSWWSATKDKNGAPYNRYMNTDLNEVNEASRGYDGHGLSVRCVQD
ncbi:MAG: fibrobacter succinogenes major paralogous domain-containing protein [Chitinispirillales bacterium]|nr:fibrobacter succinogenes major paralogous domain-containing protein [Chitinispirillales bacterium]